MPRLAHVSTSRLPAPLLSSWRAELEQADSPDARAHWWRDSHWVPRGKVPGTLLAATVAWAQQQLHASLPAWRAQLATRCCDGIEFWTQRRPLGASMHLHWDCDQERARLRSKLAMPFLSVVIYLDDAGGPTLVLEQRPADGFDRVTQGALVWPHAGSLLSFDGQMLHGVCGLEGGADGAFRETLLLNFWRRRPLHLPRLPDVIVPSGPEPREAGGGEERPRELAGGGSAGVPDVPVNTGARSAEGARRVRWSSRALGRGVGKRRRGRAGVAQRLLLGMFNRQAVLELNLPPLEYRGQHVDEFEAHVGETPVGEDTAALSSLTLRFTC